MVPTDDDFLQEKMEMLLSCYFTSLNSVHFLQVRVFAKKLPPEIFSKE